ncbi:hypothetical protein C2G38_2151076 [Gigaspora rosea]|uniref:Uncharacterized protein n=1 Tax=Gigaspora rosea TaxID=44941 RepID=A0A397W8F6_9GLOM|nr:hypothetical protein C2G38_2151076 [Gigaspora rosea]
MSYYKNTKKVGKMFARLTTGGSNSAIAGSSSSAPKKAKKAKKDKKNKDKGKTKETVERAPPLIELSDRVSPVSDVPIAPMTASYEYAFAKIKKLLDNQRKLMHKVDRLMARFEEMEERIDSRLRALLKTMHSKRGTLTTKIKDIVFAVFGDSMLDWIDSNAIPDEVHNWKQSAKTKAADFKLFSPIVANDPEDTTFVIFDDDSDSSSSSSSSGSSSSGSSSSGSSSSSIRKINLHLPKDTEDQAAVSETASVPEISNVLSEGAPKTTQVQEETEKSAMQNPEEDIAEGSGSAKKQDATHNPEEDIAEGSGTSTKRNFPEIPENP